MVFLVDFVVRGLGAGIGTGAAYWVLFGLGATAGPTIAGLVADRTGFALALHAAIALQIAAVAWLLVASDALALSFSSIVIGAFFGARLLKEADAPRRLLAAGGMVAGIIALALG